jgi:hypothetical protein
MSAERASESLLRPTVAAALLPRFTDSISGSRWMTWWRWRVHVVFGLRLLGLAFPALASAHSGVSVSASVPRMVLAGAEITVPGVSVVRDRRSSCSFDVVAGGLWLRVGEPWVAAS